VDRAAGVAVDWVMDLVYESMVDQGRGGIPRSNMRRRFRMAVRCGGRPEVRRS
jgi:hypothetical protein